jgi:uncharacterized protein
MKNYMLLRWISVSVVALMLQACSSVLFIPMRQHVLTPDRVNIKYSDVYLTSQDGVRLHGWYLPAAVPARGSILFLHGNGENISTHLATVYWLPAEGYDVYLFDYRGYGASQGEVDLAGSLSDIESMIAYVAANKSTSQKVIVLAHSLGASMGIVAVSQSAHKQDMAGMISIAAFSDYGAVTRDVLSRSWVTWLFQWPLSLAMDNRFSPKKYIADISPLPIVLMHSDADEIIEFYHAAILLKAAREPKSFQTLHGDHNHVFNNTDNRLTLLESVSRIQASAGSP